MLWVHPNHIKNEQRTSVVSKKKQKSIKKDLNYNIISLTTDDNDASTSLLIDLKEEQVVLTQNTTPLMGTIYGK